MKHVPRRWARIAGLLSIALSFVAVAAAKAEGPDPSAALKSADSVMYPPSFSMNVTIETVRSGGDRSSMEFLVEHKEGRGSFMEMLSPARSRGIRFLQNEGALWMYSPRSGSRLPLRLSPRESFQGSVFSNNDVGDSTWSNDYEASLAGSTTVDSPDFGKVEVWIVSGKALRRDVPYGAIRLYLRKDGLLPLRIEYDAKSGLPLKSMELSDFAMVAGRLRPRHMVMTALDGTGERSTVDIRDLRERSDLPDAMFNQSWLVR